MNMKDCWKSNQKIKDELPEEDQNRLKKLMKKDDHEKIKQELNQGMRESENVDGNNDESGEEVKVKLRSILDCRKKMCPKRCCK